MRTRRPFFGRWDALGWTLVALLVAKGLFDGLRDALS